MRAKAKPTTFDEYLERLPEAQRFALEKVRKQIHAAAKGAEEYVGYGLPAFRFEGHPLVYLGAATHHLALYGALDAGEAFADELAGYERTKGSIHFTPERPLPAALVKKLVQARVAANRARWPAAGARRATARAPRSTPTQRR